MPIYLEAAVDKFIFRVANDRLYSAHGIWISEQNTAAEVRLRVGLTDYVQQLNGDIAFVHVRPAGTEVSVGEELADIETIKATMSIVLPFTGRIVEVNRELALNPEAVNQDPYGKGWIALLTPTHWDQDSAKLLDPEAYLSSMRSQAEAELKK